MLILTAVIAYFLLLTVVGRLTADRQGNDAFFLGERRSPWYLVAIGMVGASISGVTFLSVPGMVLKQDMTYLQTCLGFIFGYAIVAFVLLPLYYRLNLTTIYSYLGQRLGRRSYKTGAWFFFLSKMSGAAVRFFVVCMLLEKYVLLPDAGVGGDIIKRVIVPPLLILCIWIYTRRSGIRTIVWTDTLQTIVMFTALILIGLSVVSQLDMTFSEAATAIAQDAHSRIFVFDDWASSQNFWKQFFSGVFIVIVMTGLDQDMMQKNLSCRSLKDAQKNMCSYSFAFIPANLLFLALGVLLVLLAQKQGIPLPAKGDELLPMFAATGRLGESAMVLFAIGIVASAFSSADSAITALTTTYCVDLRNRPDDDNFRRRAHLLIIAIFIICIWAVEAIGTSSVINAIYIMCSYTYGPLLGLFAFGMLTKRGVNDKYVPYICMASPLVCYALDTLTGTFFGYHFGYELLMLNGLLTFLGLYGLKTTTAR